MTDDDNTELTRDDRPTGVVARHRGPDAVTLIVGLLTLGMALAAFVGQVPDLSGVDPRWVLAGVGGIVGLLLLVGSLRRPRK